jgi:hypothetical protein
MRFLANLLRRAVGSEQEIVDTETGKTISTHPSESAADAAMMREFSKQQDEKNRKNIKPIQYEVA